MKHMNRTDGKNPFRTAGLIVAIAVLGLGMSDALGENGNPRGGRARRLRTNRQDAPRRHRSDNAPDHGEAADRDVDTMLDFVQQHFPQQHRNLSMLRMTDPPMFRRRMRQMLPRLQRMMTAFERNPEVGKLMVREQRLSFKIHQLAELHLDTDDPGRRAEIRKQVADLVAKRMDVEQTLREMEIHRLERRLESIKKRLARDLERRDELIQRQLDDLNLLVD